MSTTLSPDQQARVAVARNLLTAFDGGRETLSAYLDARDFPDPSVLAERTLAENVRGLLEVIGDLTGGAS